MNVRRVVGPLIPFLLVVVATSLLGGSVVSAVTVKSSATVLIGGTVTGPSESVSISGYVQVSSTMVTDPDFGTPPIVILTFDFSNVVGQGLKSGAAYTTGSDQNQLIRKLKRSDMIQVTFPYWKSSANFMSASSALASFSLSFDVVTGTLTGGSGSASSP